MSRHILFFRQYVYNLRSKKFQNIKVSLKFIAFFQIKHFERLLAFLAKIYQNTFEIFDSVERDAKVSCHVPN